MNKQYEEIHSVVIDDHADTLTIFLEIFLFKMFSFSRERMKTLFSNYSKIIFYNILILDSI